MEKKKKLKVLTSGTSRGVRYINLGEEDEERFSTLAEKVAYWKGSELAMTFREVPSALKSELSRSELDELKPTRWVSVSLEDFRKLSDDVKEVKADMKNLREEMQELRGSVPKVVVLEEISKEEARKLVEGYFEKHGQADIEELMLNLQIPVRNIVEIIDELKNEGKLVPKGER
jgi:hypothetical protein